MTPTTGGLTGTNLYGSRMPTRERLVVIGGDAAGMSAASQARRKKSADELEIVAFERGDYTSYAACGLPYLVSDVVDSIDALIARTPETFRDAHDIDVQMQHEVFAIDTAAGRVTVRDLLSGDERDESFDQLLIATGALPRRPDVPNATAGGIFGVQTVGDGAMLRADISDHDHEHEHEHAVVVGGGYIGLEMAEAMKRRGI